jgi:hypothetical protein
MTGQGSTHGWAREGMGPPTGESGPANQNEFSPQKGIITDRNTPHSGYGYGEHQHNNINTPEDILQLDFHWTSTGLPLYFHWTSTGLPLYFHWTSTGLPLDFHWTSTGLGALLGVYLIFRFYYSAFATTIIINTENNKILCNCSCVLPLLIIGERGRSKNVPHKFFKRFSEDPLKGVL